MVSEVAAENDVTLPEDFKARTFSPEEDIVQFDLVVVMDKFTAADVLREVTPRGEILAYLDTHDTTYPATKKEHSALTTLATLISQACPQVLSAAQSRLIIRDIMTVCPEAEVLLIGQVSVFDTINSMGNYSKRVRRLGEFHPQLAKIMTPDGQDIDDPLYGNKGGATEKVPHGPDLTVALVKIILFLPISCITRIGNARVYCSK